MCSNNVELLSKAIIAAKPFQTDAYMGVICTFLHIPSKRLVLSSSMLMIPTAWSKLHFCLVICLVRWQRNTFQWCMKSQEITMDKGSSCTRYISYQKCKFLISLIGICVQSISGALHCAEGIDGWHFLGKHRSLNLGPCTCLKQEC